jgi:hypothetical protein
MHGHCQTQIMYHTPDPKKVLGSHAVHNAFFEVDFTSEHDIFGHTLANVMHCLEEGLLKYFLSVFLDPLSISIKGDLDGYISPSCLVPKLTGALVVTSSLYQLYKVFQLANTPIL